MAALDGNELKSKSQVVAYAHFDKINRLGEFEMSVPKKQLSNPFSTGGGGGNFETRVQAAFVTLMLCGGFAPGMPQWPISKIKLQGKHAGFETDDFIAFVVAPGDGPEHKLLAQIKHSLSISSVPTFFRLERAVEAQIPNVCRGRLV